jgi:genome maintenance exonuclease 1
MFYASAYYEMTQIPITNLITILVTPGGDVLVFYKSKKNDYIKLLVRYIKEFVTNSSIRNEE